jgi:thioredoxin reductase (NADPH)
MQQVSKVTKNGDTFVVHLSDGTSQEAKTVLLATGSVPKKGGFKGETEFFGRGISTCATCDGFFYKNKEVALIGGGDSALEEAVYLSKTCSKVYLVHRRDTYRAAPSTIEHMKHCENIEEVTNVSVEEVIGDKMGVTRLIVKSNKTGETRQLDVPGVFVFVGRDVLSDCLKQDDGNYLCEVNAQHEVVVDLRMRTSVKGLFAAGDVRIEAAKQVVCAAADGATAAVNIIEYLG